MRLKGKIALVTGSSRGIGRALAVGMAREGAGIVINYSTGEREALNAVEEIQSMGAPAIAVKASVENVNDIKKLFAAVKAEYGKLDILVNNAGITGWSELFSTTEEQWDKVMGVNAKGCFFCSLEAARIMRECGGGSIINISTNCAALGVKHLTLYASSKGAIHAMTKQLACELAPYGIRVNTFAPGPTNVERNLNDDPNYRLTWGKVLPLGRTADPEDMVGACVFLASGESSFMTGQIFYVDGGWSVQGKSPEDYWDMALTNN